MFDVKFDRDMIRPIVYKCFMRLVYGTAAALLADFFLKDSLRDIKSYGFALCAALCALGAWLNYLRLDGMHLPGGKGFKIPRRKKRVVSYADVDDHIDDATAQFENMDDDEKQLCVFIADLIMLPVFIIISFIV